MDEVMTIGLDLAENVFQVYGIAGDGKILFRGQLRRGEVMKFFHGLPLCLVGMEGCGTAHHWAREIAASGYTVKLMPPAYIQYVKRGKTDAPMPRRSAKRSPGRPCALWPSRPWTSRPR